MVPFMIRRLLASILVLMLSSVLVFTLVASSGDPLADLKGRNPPVPAHVIEARRHRLQLDRSLPERYWHWIHHFVRGDMGQSVRDSTSDHCCSGGWPSPCGWWCWPSSWRCCWPSDLGCSRPYASTRPATTC